MSDNALNDAERDLLAKVRRARTLRQEANQAYDLARDAKSNYELLNDQAQQAEKAADAAWRRLANPELFDVTTGDE